MLSVETVFPVRILESTRAAEAPQTDAEAAVCAAAFCGGAVINCTNSIDICTWSVAIFYSCRFLHTGKSGIFLNYCCQNRMAQYNSAAVRVQLHAFKLWKWVSYGVAAVYKPVG